MKGVVKASIVIPIMMIVAIQYAAHTLPVTGDEPSYIYIAFSLFSTGEFSAPFRSFTQAFPQFASLNPQTILDYPRPVLLSILGAPFVGLFGIEGGRWFSCLCGLAAFIAIRRLVVNCTNPLTASAVSLFIFITFPVVAYLHLFYTDIASLAAVSWAWALTQSGTRTSTKYLAALLAISLPFFHIRMSLVSATLVLFAMSDAWRNVPDRRDRARALGGIAVIAAAGLVIFVWQQYERYGMLTGGASGPVAPGLFVYFDQLALQALDFRHGLITCNPAVILAIAGLIMGLRTRSRLAVEACALLLIYTVSFVWGTASESFPARFWVPIMPVFAVGFSFWLKSTRTIPAYLAGGVLIALSLVNLGIYLHDQGLFLENRTASLTYDSLFDVFPYIDLAGLLPWDTFNYTDHGIAPHPEVESAIMLRAATFTLALIAAFVLAASSAYQRASFRILPLGLITLLIYGGTMRAVPDRAMRVLRIEPGAGQEGSIQITFCRPVSTALIRYFGSPRALMVPPAYPKEFTIAASSDGEHFDVSETYPTSPVINPPHGLFRALRISAPATTADAGWVRAPVQILVRGRPPRCQMPPKQP